MASALWYLQAGVGQWSATAARRVDWLNDDITVSLHTSAYTPNQDTDDFFNDATNEVSGGNYARQDLTTSAPAPDTATNTVALGASDTTFPNLTATFRYVVIWKDTGTASTSPLLGFMDVGAQSVSATNFVIDWSDTGGVLQAVAS
jgi:hypothetical protein